MFCRSLSSFFLVTYHKLLEEVSIFRHFLFLTLNHKYEVDKERTNIPSTGSCGLYSSNHKDYTQPHNSCSMKGALGKCEHCKKKAQIWFFFLKSFTVHSETVSMWHVHAPDLHACLPHGQQLISRLLEFSRVSEADQTRKRYLPTGNQYGSVIVSLRAKVLFRTWDASGPLRPPRLGLQRLPRRPRSLLGENSVTSFSLRVLLPYFASN